MRKKNIIFFLPSELYDGAESLVTLKFMRLLGKNNNVYLIYRCKKTDFIQEDPLQIRQYCKGIPLFFPGKIGSLEWSIRAFLHAWRICRRNKFDVIISRIMPIFGHLPALFLHFFTKIPWCANWSDPYPQITAPAPYGDGRAAKIPFWQKKFCQLMVNSANCHTFPSERLLELYQFFFPKLVGKSFVIPHVMFDSASRTCVGENSALELVYAGSGLAFRQPEIIVDAIEKTRIAFRGDLKIHVTFYGEIYLPLKRRIEESSCKHYFTLAGKVSYSQTIECIKKADLALLLEAPCNVGVFLSSKLLDYLQCGKPIFAISPNIGVMADLIHNFGGGVLADCASPNDISIKLQEIYSDWIADRLKSPRYDTSRLREYFSESHVLSQWNVISRFLSKE